MNHPQIIEYLIFGIFLSLILLNRIEDVDLDRPNATDGTWEDQRRLCSSQEDLLTCEEVIFIGEVYPWPLLS